MSFHVPERHRVKSGPLASDESYGNNGMFYFKALVGAKRPDLKVIASDGEGWEHVSVSTQNRCPTWEEMAWIKSVFWDAEDCVMQLHPPRSQYVNCHPYCLHLWRHIEVGIPQPPMYMVGPKEAA